MRLNRVEILFLVALVVVFIVIAIGRGSNRKNNQDNSTIQKILTEQQKYLDENKREQIKLHRDRRIQEEIKKKHLQEEEERKRDVEREREKLAIQIKEVEGLKKTLQQPGKYRYVDKAAPDGIYILQSGDEQYFKIGITSNVHKRKTNLQSGNPLELKIRKYIKINNAKGVENNIHKRLKNYRVRGEWFKASYDHIKNVFESEL